MHNKNTHGTFRTVAILCALSLSSWCNMACAVDYFLRADTVTVTMPDGRNILMWGFAQDTAFEAHDGAVTVPGPALTVPAGDTQLLIHLENNLPEPISLVIHGQTATMIPVMAGGRVRSFTHETSPGNSTVVDYVWDNPRPGTYLYQSGTHPAVQVQMGLYGAMTMDFAAAPNQQLYSGIGYDHALTLLFSEIDPALHDAVQSGAYGTPTYPSTINYAPNYFLINGKPYSVGDTPLAAGVIGERTVLRFLNAGLQTHVPVLQGPYLQLVAEDGHPYPYTREQYSVFLPAAKTVDAILAPTTGSADPVEYPLYDRRLDVANPPATPGVGMTPGGMLAFLRVAAGGTPNTAPSITSTAVVDATQDQPYSYQVVATDTEGGVAYGLEVAPAGMTIDNTGLIHWTPGTLQVGAQSVKVVVLDEGGLFTDQSYVVQVANVNDAPVAVQDSYSVLVAGGTLTVAAPGVLTNDSDVDGDALSASRISGPGAGVLTLNSNGGFTYKPNTTFTGTDTFTYRAFDSLLNSNPVTVQIAVPPNKAPVAVNNTVSTRKNTARVIAVLNNDYDPDGTLNVATVTIVTAPTKGGKVVVFADGTVKFTPKLNFLGTDTFRYRVKDNLGLLSNTATVRVNVVR